MNKHRIIFIAALALAGCIDQTAPKPKLPFDGEWCDKVGTFPHASGGTVTFENVTWLREEMVDGMPWIVEVRACKMTINPPTA